MYELETKLGQDKQTRLLKEADAARRLAAARCPRSWRFRLADSLLSLATWLSPYHRGLIQAGRQRGTIGS